MLTKLFNQFLKERLIEVDFTQAIGLLILKKGSAADQDNFRLIFLLNTYFKILKNKIMRRLQPYTLDIMDPCQG